MIALPPRLLTIEARLSRAREAGVVSLSIVSARVVNPDRPLPFDLCLFKHMTGLPCPTCGLTRALCHALRGEWTVSLAYHPAGVLLAAALTCWTLWLVAEAARGEPLAEASRDRLATWALSAGAAVSVVGWIARLAELRI